MGTPETINIQIWSSNEAKNWDDIKHTVHVVENAGEVAQAIADSTGHAVRMTRPFGGITDVGRLNGGYFSPKVPTKKSEETATEKVINILTEVTHSEGRYIGGGDEPYILVFTNSEDEQPEYDRVNEKMKSLTHEYLIRDIAERITKSFLLLIPVLFFLTSCSGFRMYHVQYDKVRSNHHSVHNTSITATQMPVLIKAPRYVANHKLGL